MQASPVVNGTPDGGSARPAPVAVFLRPLVLIGIALALGLPFLFTDLPPLADVPGHLGRFAVQTAAPGDPVLRWFGFHWALVLNLAADLLVQALHPALGVVPATRLLCAATPVLTAGGVLLLARALNGRGAAAVPWALLFVWNYAFLWGFLNYALTLGAALLATAAWIAAADHKAVRAAAFLLLAPALMIGHGVAGALGVSLILAHESALAWPEGRLRWAAVGRGLRAGWPVLLGAAALLLAWHVGGATGTGPTLWLPGRKVEAVAMALRDQSLPLDIGSVVASGLVLGLGRFWGARYSRVSATMVLGSAALFLGMPSLLGGSDRLDTRVAPLVAMLALALQDWSAVPFSRRRAVLAFGWALLVIRLAVTTVSFAGYDARYRAELGALEHIRPGARVLAFAQVNCAGAAWRSERVEHLPALATLYRGAWVNAHWSIGGLQLLTVRYRPGAFWRDPSQLVWPETCVDRSLAAAQQDRLTLGDALRRAPLGKVDYLWLLDQQLPSAARDPRLRPVWRNATSELYAVGR